MEENPLQDIGDAHHGGTAAFNPPQTMIINQNDQGDNEKLHQTSQPAESAPLSTFHKFPALPNELQDMIWGRALPRPRCIIPEFTYMPSCNTDPELLNLYVRVRRTFVGQDDRRTERHLVTQWGKVVEKTGAVTPRPTLLWACHNSRRVALLTYDRCFSWNIDPRSLFMKGCSDYRETWRSLEAFSERTLHRNFGSDGIWFQSHVDTIYLTDLEITSHLVRYPNCDIPFQNIKKLAIRSTMLRRTALLVRNCLRDTSLNSSDSCYPTVSLTGKSWFEDLEELTIVDCGPPEGVQIREAEFNTWKASLSNLAGMSKKLRILWCTEVEFRRRMA